MTKYVGLATALFVTLNCTSAAPDSIENIPCQWEDSDDLELQVFLASMWEETQVLAGKHAAKPRPLVCAREGAWPIVIGGVSGLLCGMYTPKRNDVIIMIDERCPDIRCLVIHEYLHAVLGAGHTKHKGLLKKAGCGE